MLSQEMCYKLMRLLEANPHLSQRDAATALREHGATELFHDGGDVLLALP